MSHAARILLLALVPGVAACASGDDPGDEGRYAGRELDQPVAKPSFTLTNVETGEPWAFAEETEEKVALLFFGYTHCPDVCPVHMGNLAAVLKDLPTDVARRIEVVFVSTDPERDTPERMRAWLGGFDRSFVGLRGSREAVNAIEAELRLPSSVVEESDSTGERFVGHAAQVLAFGLDDTARVAYPWGTRQRDWRRDLPRLVEEEAGS